MPEEEIPTGDMWTSIYELREQIKPLKSKVISEASREVLDMIEEFTSVVANVRDFKARLDKLETSNQATWLAENEERTNRLASRLDKLEGESYKSDRTANSVRDHGELISYLEDQCGSITLRLDGSADLHNKQRVTSENHAERLRVSEERLAILEVKAVGKPADGEDDWIPCSERMPQEGEIVMTKAHEADFQQQHKLIRGQDEWIYYKTKIPVNHYAPEYWKPISEEKPADSRGDWIPCGKYLPPDGIAVDTKIEGHDRDCRLWLEKARWYFEGCDDPVSDPPTHWKPVCKR